MRRALFRIALPAAAAIAAAAALSIGVHPLLNLVLGTVCAMCAFAAFMNLINY